MQFDYSSQNNAHPHDTMSSPANQSISHFHAGVGATESSAVFCAEAKQREDHAKETLVAVIYRVDLSKDAITALQRVGGIQQTASSLKLETCAMELLESHRA